MDAALVFASPQPSPGTLGARLAAAAGSGLQLTSPEKNLTVEEWVRFRAGQGEEALRRKCEACVAAFEREGVRALAVLGGIGVV